MCFWSVSLSMRVAIQVNCVSLFNTFVENGVEISLDVLNWSLATGIWLSQIQNFVRMSVSLTNKYYKNPRLFHMHMDMVNAILL